MKKLLAILGAFGLTATGATTVIACKNDKVADNDLSKITKINAPTTITATDYTQVTRTEVISALESNVLSAVKEIVKTVVATDYTYDVFKDNKGGVYANLDLSSTTGKNQDVYVKISAAAGKSVVINSTGYIKVTLPQEGTVVKQDIAGTTVADPGLTADSNKTYADLLADQTLIKAIVAGIKTKTGVDTVVTTEILL